MTTSATRYRFSPRGTGLNWLPCGFCDRVDEDPDDPELKTDCASFTEDEESGNAIVAMLAAKGVKATLDGRRGSERRFQVKIGCCADYFCKEQFHKLIDFGRATKDLCAEDLERIDLRTWKDVLYSRATHKHPKNALQGDKDAQTSAVAALYGVKSERAGYPTQARREDP